MQDSDILLILNTYRSENGYEAFKDLLSNYLVDITKEQLDSSILEFFAEYVLLLEDFHMDKQLEWLRNNSDITLDFFVTKINYRSVTNSQYNEQFKIHVSYPQIFDSYYMNNVVNSKVFNEHYLSLVDRKLNFVCEFIYTHFEGKYSKTMNIDGI